ncbi:hypothetical protein MRX96_024054 [Rhipicephalus microplus]
MTILKTILDLGRLVDHIRITYESFGGFKDTDCVRELTVLMKNVKEFSATYVNWNNEVTYRNVSASFQLTPTIQKERLDKFYQQYSSHLTVSGAFGVAIENEPYVDAVFRLHKEYGKVTMNDVVESLCIQNLVGFTDIQIFDSFYGNSGTTKRAIRSLCFSRSYNIFSYAINCFFFRPIAVPYEEVMRFAENISREIPLFLRGNSSLLDKSGWRYNFGAHISRAKYVAARLFFLPPTSGIPT